MSDRICVKKDSQWARCLVWLAQTQIHLDSSKQHSSDTTAVRSISLIVWRAHRALNLLRLGNVKRAEQKLLALFFLFVSIFFLFSLLLSFSLSLSRLPPFLFLLLHCSMHPDAVEALQLEQNALQHPLLHCQLHYSLVRVNLEYRPFISFALGNDYLLTYPHEWNACLQFKFIVPSDPF